MAWDFQDLFRRYAGEIDRALRRRGVSVDTAADLTQDTFLRVIRTRPPGIDNQQAFLHRVARNLSIDLQRRERRQPMVQVDDAVLEAVADPAPSAETVVYDRERLRLVEAALRELPARSRSAFALYQTGERPIAEVARQLGISTTQAWRLIRDCYQHVQLRLDQADAR